MPRIFNVTFTREFQCSIVADSKEELDAALKNQSHEFEEWTDDEWEYQITDYLNMVKKMGQPDLIPKTFKEPDMGVEEGECLNILDYAKKHPNYLDRVNAEATEVARQITLDKVTPRLFPED